MSIFNEHLLYRASLKSSTYNVTVEKPLPSGFYTLESAINAVEEPYRKTALRLVFEVSAGVWKVFQFVSSLENWSNSIYWYDVTTIPSLSIGDLSVIDTSYTPLKSREIPYLNKKYMQSKIPVVAGEYHCNQFVQTGKVGGVCFRLDDSARDYDIVEYSRLFDKYGVKFLWSVNFTRSNSNKPPFLDVIRDIEARGHQLADHTPNHSTCYSDMKYDDLYEEIKVHPGVLSYDDELKRIYYKWEFPELDDSLRVMNGQSPRTITSVIGTSDVVLDFPSEGLGSWNLYFVYTTEFGWLDVLEQPTTTLITLVHPQYKTPVVFTQEITEVMYAVPIGAVYLSQQGTEAILKASAMLANKMGLAVPRFAFSPGAHHAVFYPPYLHATKTATGLFGGSSYNPTFDTRFPLTHYIVPSFGHEDSLDAFRLPYWLSDSERCSADAVFRVIVNNSARHIHTVDLNHYFLAYRYDAAAVDPTTGKIFLTETVMDIPPSPLYPSGFSPTEWSELDLATKRLVWNALTQTEREQLQRARFFSEMDKLLGKLVQANIPILTHTQLLDLMFRTPQNPQTNMFPPMYRDTSNQGYPDGYTIDSTASYVKDDGVSDSRGCSFVRSNSGTFIELSPIKGFHTGRNKFVVWAKGDSGGSITIELIKIVKVYAVTAYTDNEDYESHYGRWFSTANGVSCSLTLTLDQVEMSSTFVEYVGYIDIPADLDPTYTLRVKGSFSGQVKISGLYLGKA